MGLFGMFERRNLQDPSVPISSGALASLINGPATSAGVVVTSKSSLAFSAVWRSVNLVSGVAAALPLKVYTAGTRDERPSMLLDNPHPDLTAFELWRWTYVQRCLWGNAYMQKMRDGAGRLQWLNPLPAEKMTVCRVAPSENNSSGKLFEYTDFKGVKHPLSSTDVFHIPGFGYDGVCGVSPIRLASQGIGLGLAAEEYGARLFGSGSLMSGILQTEQRLEQPQAEALRARWQEKVAGIGRAHEIAVLDSGAKFESVTMPNTDAQFIESRRFQATEIGRFFGVPAFLMGETEKSTSWGTGLEQQAQGWVTFDLGPQWLVPTEQRITKELTGPGVYVKYKVQGLLRGDSTARAEFYRTMREVGAFSANDIRELEDLPPIPDGDTRLQPLNMAPLGSEGTDNGGTANGQGSDAANN